MGKTMAHLKTVLDNTGCREIKSSLNTSFASLPTGNATQPTAIRQNLPAISTCGFGYGIVLVFSPCKEASFETCPQPLPPAWPLPAAVAPWAECLYHQGLPSRQVLCGENGPPSLPSRSSASCILSLPQTSAQTTRHDAAPS